MIRMLLVRRAIHLFPMTGYTDPQAVDYARKRWLECVEQLRSRNAYAFDHLERRQ